MIRYEVPVPGTDLRLEYERDEDGRLVELRCGGRVHVRRDGDTTVYGDGLATAVEERGPDGLVRTVEAAGERWTERYLWDADRRLSHVDGVDVRRDARGRITACTDTGSRWRYGYAGDDLAVVDAPAATRHLTADGDGRPVLVRTGTHRRRVAYREDGVRLGAPDAPATWRTDPAGRLFTVVDQDGTVQATYLWDGPACLGRIDGPPDRPLSTVYSLDPSNTPVRIIGPRSVVRVPRDAYGEGLLAHPGTPGLFGGAVHRGLVHLPARALDPRLGAFCSADPFHGGPGDPRRADGFDGGLPVEPETGSRYAVCRHDPVGRADPTGAISASLVWMPLSDISWGLQNNLFTFLGMDFTLNLWGSLIGGMFDHSLPGRFGDFEGLSASGRIGSYSVLRDGLPFLASSTHAFTLGHETYAAREHEQNVQRANVVVPTAALPLTHYGTIVRVVPGRGSGRAANDEDEAPFLMFGDRTLPSTATLTDWTRSGGPVVPALPGSLSPSFPSGGLHFTPLAPDTRVSGPQSATLIELPAVGSPATVTGDANGLITLQANLNAPGAQAVRLENYTASPTGIAGTLLPGIARGGATGTTLTGFATSPAAAVRPGQVVFLDDGTNREPVTVARVIARLTFDRDVDDAATGLAGTRELTRLMTAGPIYAARRVTDAGGNLLDLRLAVQPTVNGVRVQFPRFRAGELVEVGFTNQPGHTLTTPQRFAVVSAADGDLVLHPSSPPHAGQPALPTTNTDCTIQRLVPQSSGTGGIRVGLNGTPVAGTATQIDMDVWGTDLINNLSGTLLAVSDTAGARPVVLSAIASITVELTSAPATVVANAIQVLVPNAPATVTFHAAIAPTGANAVNVTHPPAPAAVPNTITIATFFGSAAAAAPGRLSSGGVRVPEAGEDFEIDRWQSVVDHELTHTIQEQRLGPWFLAFWPMWVLHAVTDALPNNASLPKYGPFVAGRLATPEPGKRVLTILDTKTDKFSKGDDVQVWNGGTPKTVKLGTSTGTEGEFVVNTAGIGPDGDVQLRSAGIPAGLKVLISFFEVTTHGGLLDAIAGAVWGGILWPFAKLIYGFIRWAKDTKVPALVSDTGMTVKLQPKETDDKKKSQLMREVAAAGRVMIRKDKANVLRDVTVDVESPDYPAVLKLAQKIELTGDVEVLPDTTHGGLFDWNDYYPFTLPDPQVKVKVKLQPQAGGATLTPQVDDRVELQYGKDGKLDRSLVTYITAVEPDGTVELKEAILVEDGTAGRLARISSGDPMAWADDWALERLGFGWMRAFFDPLGQLSLRTHFPHNSFWDIFLRVQKYLFSTKSWSMGPVPFGYFWVDDAYRKNRYLSNMEQDASAESGDVYSALGRMRVTPEYVGDVGRYWFFGDGRASTFIPGGLQDTPGVPPMAGTTVLPAVSAETNTTPVNNGAGAGAGSGPMVPDAFYLKGADALAPTGANPTGFLPSDLGWIPLTPETERSLGMHVAFSRPSPANGSHRVTTIDGIVGAAAARDAHENDFTLFYDLAGVKDVTAVLGGFPVAEGAVITLLLGQHAALTVTPGGPGRTHVLTVVQPVDGPVRTEDDGATLAVAAAVNGNPVEIARRYRPDGSGVHTDGGLAGRTLHIPGDVHIPVREFSVDVTTTLILRSAALIDPANPAANQVSDFHSNGTAFLILPVTTASAPVVEPAGAVAATFDPVPDFPPELAPFVGTGTVLRVTFPEIKPPPAPQPAPVNFTIRVPVVVPGAAAPGLLETGPLTFGP